MVFDVKLEHGTISCLTAFQQQEDYDCGVYATGFFLFLCGIQGINFCHIAEHLNPTPEHGTKAEAITAYCAKFMPVFVPNDGSWWILKNPAIVNFQFEDDGHFGVVTRISKTELNIFEPYRAEVITMGKKEFLKSWYSHNNGPRWCLRT